MSSPTKSPPLVLAMAPQSRLWHLAGPLVVLLAIAALWASRDVWWPGAPQTDGPSSDMNVASPGEADAAKQTVLELGPQARQNLDLIARPMRSTDYWRRVTIPGMVQDRPGVSDRGVTAPATGVVSDVHVFPGDTVRPEEPVVTLQLVGEALQQAQTRLFEASQEITLVRAELERLSGLANVGGVSGGRLIELQNQIKRQQTQVQSAQQELRTRGLSPEQISQIEAGSFVTSIQVLAPLPRSLPETGVDSASASVIQAGYLAAEPVAVGIAYEVQHLPVQLGQTVQAGERLADLSNHRSLYVVGHAFKHEASLLERAAQEERAIEIEFTDDSPDSWPPLEQTFSIRHLSSAIDAESRTLDFFVPLANQAKTYQRGDDTHVVWRFRPGQRVRIDVPVERFRDVFVMPTEGVASEGPASYVFRQNGDLFKQVSVHVLHRDRQHVVIAGDGSITPGAYFAQNAAASLQRVLKAQSASGEQPGVHVHADGTVHAAH